MAVAVDNWGVAERRKPRNRGRIQNRKLNHRQVAFVREYLVDYNATQAAIRAGYAPKAAGQMAFRLLKHVQIQAALQKAQQVQVDVLEVDSDTVLRELLQVANSDVGNILNFEGDQLTLRKPSEIPPAVRRAISSVKVKRYVEGKGDDAEPVEIVEFKLWDKISALDKLGKYLGLWRDVVVIKQGEFQRYVRAFAEGISEFVPPERQDACRAFIRARLLGGDGPRVLLGDPQQGGDA